MMQDNSPLMVTIRCITYNQEKYIRQCLDGFIMQRTSFRFEAIVHDDASTDGTADIIHEYAEKYPEIIIPIFEKENQYSKGTLGAIMDQYTRGKYVTCCEGDDFWTDPNKLQRQVDYMERHPSCVLTYTNAIVVDENSNRLHFNTPKRYSGHCLKALLLKGNFIVTASVCYRLQADEGWGIFRNSIPFKLLMGDKPHWLFLASKGEFKYIKDSYVSYRVLNESASHSKNIQKVLDFIDNGEMIALYVNRILNAGVSERRILKAYAECRIRTSIKMPSNDYKFFFKKYIKVYPNILLNLKLDLLLILRFFFNCLR